MLQSTSYFFEVPIAASQDKGMEIKFRSGDESHLFLIHAQIPSRKGIYRYCLFFVEFVFFLN